MSLQRLLATTAFALVLLAPSAASAADETAGVAADSSESLPEIMVTAQKRTENMQETPISLSVMRSEDLVNRHVTSLLDLGDGAIPSLKIAPFYARNSALIVNIRGIGVLSDANQPARDQGVGVYIDGVYMGRAQGLGTALFDVENIEVLKGPQGTLFGRNTEGGAVNIVTKKPSGEFHMNATAGVGNFGSYKGEMHLDLPSFNNIALKIDGVVAHRDPLVKNPLAGAEGFNQYDKQGLHVEALWSPTPDFSADYSFDISRDESTSLYLNLVAPGTNTQAALGTIQPNRVRTANVGVPEQPSVGKVHGHRLTLEWEASPDLSIKSISAYRKLTQDQWDNGSAATTLSATAAALAANGGGFTNLPFSRYSLAAFWQNQWSQEFQAIGEIGRVKYVAGALYYREKVRDNAQAFYTNQFTNAAGSTYALRQIDYGAQALDRASHVTTNSIGAFGQATWTPALMNDAVHLTGGLRWTRDSKKGALTIVNNALPVDRNGVAGAIGFDDSWQRVDPMVNLAIDLSKDVHVYGKWSTGYKSGGANSRSQEYDAFGPESVSIFEIGAKTEFLDHHARFNIAGYAGTYKDIQVDFLRPFETGGIRTTRTTLSTINAPGTGGLHGIEADLTVNPFAGLTLSASYAYQYVRIPATVNPYPNAAGVVSGIAVPIYQTYTPTHSASGAIDYELPLDDFTIRAHLDGNYDDGFYVSATDPVYAGPNNAANIYQPKGEKAFIVNGRLSLADIALGSGDAKMSVALWARNLFNEQHLFYKSLSPSSGLNGFFNEPRTFGGEMNIRF